jgi:lysosomal acid lipase/cholesteryl ester hydrolase
MAVCKVAVLVTVLACLGFARDPDAARNFTAMVEGNGYDVEEHSVTTEDGYILTLFRIPGKAGNHGWLKKPAVFMQHGLWDSSFTWIVNGVGKAPAYLMADAGWDVWMGNNRGNYFSWNHTFLSQWSTEYWEFTWQQMAEFDIPAMIDYTLEETGQKALVYVGHSEGTTQMFAKLSETPNFADKINLFIGLAPVASTKHLDSIVIHALSYTPFLEVI